MSKAKPQPVQVMRGFILATGEGGSVSVTFDGDTRDLWITQGDDKILIDADAVEAFKRGMTWVRADVLVPA